MIVSVLPLYFNAYFPQILPDESKHKYFLLISADLAFVISFFILGGEFWGKFKRLFTWEEQKSHLKNS